MNPIQSDEILPSAEYFESPSSKGKPIGLALLVCLQVSDSYLIPCAEIEADHTLKGCFTLSSIIYLGQCIFNNYLPTILASPFSTMRAELMASKRELSSSFIFAEVTQKKT